jgi:hypothetical protein
VAYDKDKVDDTVLALLFLTMWGSRHDTRAWKGHDWDTLDRQREGIHCRPEGQSQIGGDDRRRQGESGGTVL